MVNILKKKEVSIFSNKKKNKPIKKSKLKKAMASQVYWKGKV